MRRFDKIVIITFMALSSVLAALVVDSYREPFQPDMSSVWATTLADIIDSAGHQ